MSRRIKVAMLSDSALINTGYATITRNLLNELTAKGFDCVNFGHSNHHQNINKVSFSDDTKINFKIWGAGRQPYCQDVLIHKLKEFQPDVLIILLDTFMCYPWLLNMDLSPAKTIFYFPHDGGGQLPNDCENILKKVDLPIAMAKYGQEEAINHYDIKHCQYIPHAVHEKLYKPYSDEERKKLRTSYGFDEETFVIGTVARNQPRKMLDRTFLIFSEFVKLHPNAKLFLHSDPNDPAQSFDMNRTIKSLNLENNIIFSGMTWYKGFDYRRMPDIYNLMDVFLLSTSGEGFGVPTIEAMSCEVPVLVTDYTTTKELVLDWDSGLAINLSDYLIGSWNVERGICSVQDGVKKLERMYSNWKNKTELWKTWKANGRKACLEEYNWKYCTDRWVDEIEKLVGFKNEVPDEEYFKDRGLEIKHYEDALIWRNYFEPDTALCVGCGRGPRVYTLNKFGVETTGWEKSKFAVENSFDKKNVVENVIDEELPAPQKKYDLVVAYDVLEHISYEKLDLAISNLRLLTNNFLIVSVPVLGDPNLEADPTHIIKETKEWWYDKIETKGFKRIETPEHFIFGHQLLIFETIEEAPIKESVGVVSGYFNPLHKGHIDYINDAAKRCDKLYVIVNNDEQVKLKGSKPFMDEIERAKIVENLKCVEKVVLSIDKDLSVCETLKFIKPDFFFNGGDRKSSEVPEHKICKDLGIKMVNNVGGKKTQSSSELLK